MIMERKYTLYSINYQLIFYFYDLAFRERIGVVKAIVFIHICFFFKWTLVNTLLEVTFYYQDWNSRIHPLENCKW